MTGLRASATKKLFVVVLAYAQMQTHTHTHACTYAHKYVCTHK